MCSSDLDASSNGNRLPLLLTIVGGDSVEWVSCVGPEENATHIVFNAESLPHLRKEYDLLTTEDALVCAVEVSQGRVWQYVDEIQVFARMSPHGKAKVIRMIQQFQPKDYLPAQGDNEGGILSSNQKNFVMMVGDGGNDVGALKQADVGLALLGGYGNANTDETKTEDSEVGAEALLNKQDEEMRIRQKLAKKEYTKEFNVKRTQMLAKQKERIAAEIAEATSRGDAGFWTQIKAAQTVAFQIKSELQKEAEILQRKHYNFMQNKNGDDKKVKDLSTLSLEALDDPNALPLVRPGDASVAAPFTSRIPSVRAAIHLIRQGRCTLLSALQQQGIMCLESVISAYCQAALSLEGARSSERQMIASSWLIMTASLAFSYSTPVDKVHPVRPVRSLFHPVVVFSILGQACIHLYCMVTAVNLAKEAMGEEALAEVVAFNRRVASGLDNQLENANSGTMDYIAEMLMLWNSPFKPNLLNTCMFLVETSQIMAVLFVNYKGRPWMLGMVENHALFLSLFICVGALLFATFEVLPGLNQLIHLHEFPGNEFRLKIISIVSMTLFGTFAWDRLVTAIFAPKTFKAQLEQALETRIDDVIPIFKTLLKVVVGFAVVGSGNPLIWIGAFWLYKKYQTSTEEIEFKKFQGDQ